MGKRGGSSKGWKSISLTDFRQIPHEHTYEMEFGYSDSDESEEYGLVIRKVNGRSISGLNPARASNLFVHDIWDHTLPVPFGGAQREVFAIASFWHRMRAEGSPYMRPFLEQIASELSNFIEWDGIDNDPAYRFRGPSFMWFAHVSFEDFQEEVFASGRDNMEVFCVSKDDVRKQLKGIYSAMNAGYEYVRWREDQDWYDYSREHDLIQFMRDWFNRIRMDRYETQDTGVKITLNRQTYTFEWEFETSKIQQELYDQYVESIEEDNEYQKERGSHEDYQLEPESFDEWFHGYFGVELKGSFKA